MFVPVFLLSYGALHASALSIPRLPQVNHFLGIDHGQQPQQPLQNTLDAWIAREEAVALDNLLANVAPGGRNVQGKGIKDGTVIASPSQRHPDYWFQWVRDAAITIDTLVDLYASTPSSSPLASNLSTIISAYSSLQHIIQHTSNPSGSFSDLSGLGEPKFHVDGTPFTGSWGRPQRDGPALRALTLMHYLREYNVSHPEIWTSNQAEDFFAPYYSASMPPESVIKADLEYVSHFWDMPGFDLWEEVQGMHFFTLMVSARSLREGSTLAGVFGDNGAAEWYKEQAERIEDVLGMFWDSEKGHLVETLGSSRSGLDCALLLGSLHGQPRPDSPDKAFYPPWSDEVLVSLLALTRDQSARFPINSRTFDDNDDNDDNDDQDSASDFSTSSPFPFSGTGIGRYPEDVYNGYATSPHGGNPWFLCTSSAATILYRTASHLSSTSRLHISPTSLPFYAALLATSSLDVNVGTYTPADVLFHSVVDRLVDVGDEFLATVRKHVDGEGRMSEQFDRATGFMRGAADLTWSYGAFLGAVRARKGM